MQTVILLMWRQPVAQRLMMKLREEPDIQLVYISDYKKAEADILMNKSGVILIEAAEAGEGDVSDCLVFCVRLRKITPDFKLLLLCPATDEKGIASAVDAMRSGLIDDFIFSDASIDYLTTKLMSWQEACLLD